MTDNYISSTKIRDEKSGALLSKDSNALAEYKAKKKQLSIINNLKDSNESLLKEVNSLTDRVAKLESVIEKILKKVDE